ncbi:Uncharacterised protein [Vibrio cholerae]|nr:Uncharacterised protein [Vibrio cholerae]CSI96495.1 Uncharacterised protein [Vibrio cholerae]
MREQRFDHLIMRLDEIGDQDANPKYVETSCLACGRKRKLAHIIPLFCLSAHL